MIYSSTVVRGFSCFLLLASVSACTYLIPEDVSAPRHNIVQGERHKPLRNGAFPQANPAPQNGAGLATPNEPHVAMAAPVVPVAVNPLNVPIPTTLQYPQMAPAASPTAVSGIRSTVISPVPPAQDTSFNPLAPVPALRQAPAENPTDLSALSPRRVPVENNPLTAPTQNASLRRSPVENGSFLMAANTPSQGLMHVPARPVMNGLDSASSRLGAVRKDLEESRTSSDDAKTQLGRDVAAEPSVFTKPAISANAPDILSPLPVTPAPVAAPVPTPAMAPATAVPPSVALPTPAPVTPRVAPAPTSALVPPAAPIATAPMPAPAFNFAPLPAAPAPQVASKTPAPVPRSLPPIQLKSPEPIETAALAPIKPVMPAAKGAGFDPMAALPPEPPAAPQMPPIALTPPAPPVAQPLVVRQKPQEETPSMVVSSSAFNPLDGDSDSRGGKSPSLQYLTPSRYSYRR